MSQRGKKVSTRHNKNKDARRSVDVASLEGGAPLQRSLSEETLALERKEADKIDKSDLLAVRAAMTASASTMAVRRKGSHRRSRSGGQDGTKKVSAITCEIILFPFFLFFLVSLFIERFRLNVSR